jgi:hypothetical protein
MVGQGVASCASSFTALMAGSCVVGGRLRPDNTAKTLLGHGECVQYSSRQRARSNRLGHFLPLSALSKCIICSALPTASVVQWSDFLAANPEVPSSIPDTTTFSEYQWVCNGIHSALVRINEELLERKVVAPI